MIRNIIKNRAGMEDLLTGIGSESQDRAGQTVTVHKVDVAFAVNSVADMQALDVSRFIRARVYSSVNNYITYAYDPADNTGIPSSTGPGSWVVVPESESVVVATDKGALRNEEPAYNLQCAFALGGTSLYNGYGACYFYDQNNTSSDDGDNTLVTTGGARWIKWMDFDTDSMGMTYVEASGGTNNLEVVLGVTGVPANQVISIKVPNTNTGTITLKLDALAAMPVVKTDGSSLAAGDVEAGKIYSFLLKATEAVILNPSISQARAELGADNVSVPTILRVKQLIDKTSLQLALDMDLTEGLYCHGDGTIEPGFCKAQNADFYAFLNSAITKDLLSTWTAGNNVGGRASGVALTDNTWYILFLIAKPDGTVDAGWDIDVNATKLLASASGYTMYKAIGLRWYWSGGSPSVEDFTDRKAFNIKRQGAAQVYKVYDSVTTTLPPLTGYAQQELNVALQGGGSGGGHAGSLSAFTPSANGANGGDTSVTLKGTTYTALGGILNTAHYAPSPEPELLKYIILPVADTEVHSSPYVYSEGTPSSFGKDSYGSGGASGYYDGMGLIGGIEGYVGQYREYRLSYAANEPVTLVVGAGGTAAASVASSLPAPQDGKKGIILLTIN